MWIGIDPGKKGGIVGVDQLGQITCMMPMPEPQKLADFLASNKSSIAHVCLEKAQTMGYVKHGRKQSISSMFNYGCHYGIIQGVMIAYDIGFDLVRPQQWQKSMFCSFRSKGPKAKALASANKVFKKTKSFWLPTPRYKNPHDGLIDAALIAEYCRRAKLGCPENAIRKNRQGD